MSEEEQSNPSSVTLESQQASSSVVSSSGTNSTSAATTMASTGRSISDQKDEEQHGDDQGDERPYRIPHTLPPLPPPPFSSSSAEPHIGRHRYVRSEGLPIRDFPGVPLAPLRRTTTDSGKHTRSPSAPTTPPVKPDYRNKNPNASPGLGRSIMNVAVLGKAWGRRTRGGSLDDDRGIGGGGGVGSLGIAPLGEEGPSEHSARPFLLHKAGGIRGPRNTNVLGSFGKAKSASQLSSSSQSMGTDPSSSNRRLSVGDSASFRRKWEMIYHKQAEERGSSLMANSSFSSSVASLGGRTASAMSSSRGSDESLKANLHSAMASGTLQSDAAGAAAAVSAAMTTVVSRNAYRRYRVGEHVLVCNHQSRWAKLVNKYGFPEGAGSTPEEQQGPYVYILATVVKVHFEEDAQYYTVTRADTGANQRADAEWMEPLWSKRGEAAALAAANESAAFSLRGGPAPSGPFYDRSVDRSAMPWYSRLLAVFLCPFFLFYHILGETVGRCCRVTCGKLHGILKRQATLFLNGLSPYSCSIRMTGINLLVLCSTWYMFIDQVRLAFIPPSADDAVCLVSAVVWLILFLELIFEVFIRPDNYFRLVRSERAYEPSTVRYISRFHLVTELASLLLFIPEFVCVFTSRECGDRPKFSLLNATIMAVVGPTRLRAFYGRAYIALVRLRIFGLVRHWRNMWLSSTIHNPSGKRDERGMIRGVLLPQRRRHSHSGAGNFIPTKEESTGSDETTGEQKRSTNTSIQQDKYLTNATNIGTALTTINSHRALILVVAIIALLPVIITLLYNGGVNDMGFELAEQMQATNLMLSDSDEASCTFLQDSVVSWFLSTESLARYSVDRVYVLSLQILPVRCPFQNGTDGFATTWACNFMESTGYMQDNAAQLCEVWKNTDSSTTIDDLADRAGIRVGVITVASESEVNTLTFANGTSTESLFSVTAVYDNNQAVVPSAALSFILQALLLIFILAGLTVLRCDAGRLVLGPLRRMLKIVALYAKNPLAQPKHNKKSGKKSDSDEDSTDDESDSDSDGESTTKDQLGNYETEQLINAVTKITDLLRKCWGVAGAGIISSNLARQKDGLTAMFNPCVPGKCVYALFGFAAIKGFDQQLRALGGDIMILINDVAAVLHGEVFRWGLGDSGQCNKNLGSAFLLVYRIGDMFEVKEKLDRATDVVFSGIATEKRPVRKTAGARRRFKYQSARSRSGTSEASESSSSTFQVKRTSVKTTRASLNLSSLPGINAFTDRALIGLLKSYAGIYRDHKLLNWKNDFRLGAGVGAFSVDMIFGMDAGWAVEGAVGSEYKIDATYLSPHVNMASRMMSACKQYGVSILLSQAVEELLSDAARAKLRHLDTVTVKGSSVKQRIFTYDARHKGVDFFLFGRSEEQADLDSDRYTPTIWNTDQDLKTMRQHVTEEFEEEFNKGRREYLAGNWPAAIEHLKAADDIMVETVMDQGYVNEEINELRARQLDGEDVEIEEALVRAEMGDGPSRLLIAFMEKEGGKAPKGWKGYRPLTSK